MSAIDKNVKAQQEDRLNKKHIQTLGYVQELMNENKKLRNVIEEYEQQKLHCDDLHAQNDAAQEKIKMIQAQCMARADEINASLVRKHGQEQIKLKEAKLEAEKRLEMQTKEMATEIERLQKLNASLEEALKAKSSMASSHMDMKQQNEILKQQIINLQVQITSLTQSNENQLKEMKKLEKEIEQQKLLKEQMSSANQTIKELQSRIKQLESELYDANSALSELQDNEMKSYKNKLIKALNEVSHLQTQLYQKEEDVDSLKRQITELMTEVETVQKQRFTLEREREALKKQIADLKLQLAKARGKQEEGGSFKDFVAVKRELVNLQEEHCRLKERMLPNQAVRLSSAKSSSKQKINLKFTTG